MSKNMTLVAYEPPPGHPPFVFTYNGTRYAFMPPDMHWREVRKESVYAYKTHPQTGALLEKHPVKQFKKVWEPDYELTAKSKVKPDNTLWIPKSALRCAQQNKYRAFNQYLRDITHEANQRSVSVQELRKKHQDEVAAMEQAFQERSRDMQREMDLIMEQKRQEQMGLLVEKASEFNLTMEKAKELFDAAAAAYVEEQRKAAKASEALSKNAE